MMLDMVKKNGAAPPREGTAAAMREVAQSGSTPGLATAEQARRRRFSAEYKRRVLQAADAAAASGEEGAVGALLRREGLYSSHLATWRRQREGGELAGLSPKKRGRKATPKNPLAEENVKLSRQVARLQHELDKAKLIIDVQKKVAALLGNPIPEAEET